MNIFFEKKIKIINEKKIKIILKIINEKKIKIIFLKK